MTTARRLILENRLGQKVRDFSVQADEIHVIYRLDTKRVEVHGDLSHFDENEIPYQLIKKISQSSLQRSSVALAEIGRIRLATENETLTDRTVSLPAEEDDKKLFIYLKKAAIGHAAAVVVLIGLSALLGYLAQKNQEPELVTISLPPKEVVKKETVQVSKEKIEKKIVPPKVKVGERTVVKKVITRKQIAQKTPPQKRTFHSSVRNAEVRPMERVGALAALGGLKNGSKSAEGLDSQSLRKIRSAGVGSGGGGVGASGSGGLKGMMPGSGLIAGSAGSGGRATSAGGYGTKGAGGGKAGYGTISLVGGTSGISLPLEEEPMVRGGLDIDQIMAVINRNKGQILYCYEQGLQGRPDLRGRVPVAFVIGGNGRVSTAKVVRSSLGAPSVESCIVAKMRTWQFPKPVGSVNVDVEYPFELRRVSAR